MTERPQSAVTRNKGEFFVGPSAMFWDDDALTVEINERAVPHMTQIRGTVTVRPQAISDKIFKLDERGNHLWHPIGPCSLIEVELDRPSSVRWRGQGYLDTNWGARPLEADFARWDWSRAPVSSGARVLYAVERRDGTHQSLGLHFGRSGDFEPFEPPPTVPLPTTLWGIKRNTSADPDGRAEVLKTLEDGPFYARSEVASRICGQDVVAMHESLSLDRFATFWAKQFLPYRMPRALS